MVTIPASTGVATAPKRELIDLAIRSDVVKSGSLRSRETVPSAVKVIGTSRSTIAPPGILPTVTTFLVIEAACPPVAKPPTSTGPWATA